MNNNSDDNSNPNQTQSVPQSQANPPVFNFGDDDDFVVPDHIQNIINEVHNPNNSELQQNTNQNFNPNVAPQTSEQNVTAQQQPQNSQSTFPQPQETSQIPSPPQDAPPQTSIPNPVVSDRQQPQVTPPEPISSVPAPEPVQSAPPQVPEAVPESPQPQNQSAPVPAEQAQNQNTGSVFDSSPAVSTGQVKLPQKKTLRPLKKIMAVVALVAVGGPSLYFGYGAYLNAKQSDKFTKVNVPKKPEEVVASVAKLIELSVPEAPAQMANVTDTKKLSTNAFFDHAKNGDVVLIYSKNQIAVLYRPSTNKIVAVGPILPSEKEQVAGASTTSGITPTPQTATPTQAPTKVPARPTATPTPTQEAIATPAPTSSQQ